MNEKKIGYLGYNKDTKRYGILITDLWANDGLHCGTTLEIFVDGEWKRDRIELNKNKEYYFIKCNKKGMELEGMRVKF